MRLNISEWIELEPKAGDEPIRVLYRTPTTPSIALADPELLHIEEAPPAAEQVKEAAGSGEQVKPKTPTVKEYLADRSRTLRILGVHIDDSDLEIGERGNIRQWPGLTPSERASMLEIMVGVVDLDPLLLRFTRDVVVASGDRPKSQGLSEKVGGSLTAPE